MKRRPRSSSYNDYDDYDNYDRGNNDRNYRDDNDNRGTSVKSKAVSWFNATAISILAGIFILGIGVGVAFSSTTGSSDPNAVVSGIQIDAKAPNADVCIQNGASAMSMSTRLYVTLNPFKVYVAQAAMEPACVLRKANWTVLEQRKLVTAEQSRECQRRMNTFSYTGNLDNKPTIDCVYQSDNAKNLFLGGDAAGVNPANDQF
jgi:Protein of unknown function (DUF3172)